MTYWVAKEHVDVSPTKTLLAMLLGHVHHLYLAKVELKNTGERPNLSNPTRNNLKGKVGASPT